MSYDKLLNHIRKTTALEQVAGIVGWDQQTQMPVNAAQQRAEHMGAMETVLHARRADPRIPEWIDAIGQANLTLIEQTNVAEAKRAYETATKVPADLGEAMAKLAARGQGIWAAARAAENVADFLPTLSEMIELKREEAACRKADGQPLYDALMEDFEPGMGSETMSAMLDELRVGLVDLRGRIADSGREMPRLSGKFDKEQQLKLARNLPAIFCYDWDSGRMDMAVHPFCSGHGSDVRITTRVDEANPFDCFYSTIHEVGHAVYEQNIAGADGMEPAHTYASMGVHESQSRMFENQIGRSRAFCGKLFDAMVAEFGDIGVADADGFYGAVNRVRSGYIRTESDEIHYNLHVMLRYDLERALIAGDLAVGDLEAAWNDRFLADFGVAVDKPSNGVLQDVHWSAGLFGYFPTYSLGNIYAGELFAKMQADIVGLDGLIAAHDLGKPVDWLTDKVHRHGRTIAPNQLIENAVGHKPGVAALLAYLNAKFGELYNV